MGSQMSGTASGEAGAADGLKDVARAASQVMSGGSAMARPVGDTQALRLHLALSV
jgi:hypothetical protein